MLPVDSTVQNPSSVYDKQYLFTIYLHPPPHHVLSYSNSSIFHGREVRRRHMVRLNGLHGLRCALHARYDLHHISGPNWTDMKRLLSCSQAGAPSG